MDPRRRPTAKPVFRPRPASVSSTCVCLHVCIFDSRAFFFFFVCHHCQGRLLCPTSLTPSTVHQLLPLPPLPPPLQPWPPPRHRPTCSRGQAPTCRRPLPPRSTPLCVLTGCTCVRCLTPAGLRSAARAQQKAAAGFRALCNQQHRGTARMPSPSLLLSCPLCLSHDHSLSTSAKPALTQVQPSSKPQKASRARKGADGAGVATRPWGCMLTRCLFLQVPPPLMMPSCSPTSLQSPLLPLPLLPTLPTPPPLNLPVRTHRLSLSTDRIRSSG